MHALVFELSKEPLSPEEYMETWNVEEDESFLGPVADYVQEVPEKEKARFWKEFVEEMAKYGAREEDGAIIFPVTFRTAWFARAFDEFRKLVSEMTLEEFSNFGWGNTYRLKKLIENKFSDHIYEGGGVYSMDYFFRSNMEPEVRYYPGGVLDFHF